MRGVDIPSDKDAVRMHVLDAVEESLYFERARQSPALYDLGRLVLNQRCRPDEILELQTGDIDLERSTLAIRTGKSRSARRTLRLTIESREICARRVMAAQSIWLFPGKVPGTRLVKLNGAHGRVLDELAACKCGLPKHQPVSDADGKNISGCGAFKEVSRLAFVTYDLRHTFATRAAESGMPIATLVAILGHGDLRSVTKYVHVRQEAQDRAMDQLDKIRNIPEEKRSSGFGPVADGETRDNAVITGNVRGGLDGSKIN